jgi:hypothetical protein
MSRGHVVSPAQPDITTVVEGTSTSDVLLLFEIVLQIFPGVKTKGS